MESFGSLESPTPARGWTFDDPDFHANWSILVGVTLYLTYEIQLYLNPSAYYTNYLYEKADEIYVFNAIFYMFGALRDFGWFWFMPSFGRFNYRRNYEEVVETRNLSISVTSNLLHNEQTRIQLTKDNNSIPLFETAAGADI